MKDYRIIEVKESILQDNDRDAENLRKELKAENTFLLNLMSSPGAGKTTTLVRTINMLHTGGMCHLDADMTRQGIREFGTKDLDLVVLENVGNLVCPAEFDTGAVKNAMILSVPEGDDKPLKYPLMFQIADVVLINKCDVLPVFDDFSKDRVVERIRMRNPNCDIIFISAKTGEGFEEWADWLRREVKTFQES